MQPNHYWKPENNLDSACMKINRAGTSIEFEFEASILSADPHSDIYRARMRKYMEYAKKHGIYGTRPLAYYQGSNALYDPLGLHGRNGQGVLPRILPFRREQLAGRTQHSERETNKKTDIP